MSAIVTTAQDRRALTLTWSAWRVAAVSCAAYGIAALPALVWWPPLPAADLAAGVVLALLLVALTAIDVRSFRLPDWLTMPLTVGGIAIAQVLGWAEWPDRVVAALIGFLVLFAARSIYRRARGQHGLGLGDAKLFAAAGAWTGLEGLAAVLLWGSGLALVSVGLLALTGREVTARTVLPFGPFLAAGIWLVWLYGPPL